MKFEYSCEGSILLNSEPQKTYKSVLSTVEGFHIERDGKEEFAVEVTIDSMVAAGARQCSPWRLQKVDQRKEVGLLTQKRRAVSNTTCFDRDGRLNSSVSDIYSKSLALYNRGN